MSQSVSTVEIRYFCINVAKQASSREGRLYSRERHTESS